MMDGNPTTVMNVLTLFTMLIFREKLMGLKKLLTAMIKEMNELLTEMKKYTDEFKDQIKASEEMFNFVFMKKMEKIGLSKPSKQDNKCKSKTKIKESKWFFYIQHKEKILTFRTDLIVSLENNPAERNIRMIAMEKMTIFPTAKAVGTLI